MNQLRNALKVATGARKLPATAPATEQKVLEALQILETQQKPTHGPAIARATGGVVSVQAVYSLLDRLAARGLVGREEVEVPLGDILVKRVNYHSRAPQ